MILRIISVDEQSTAASFSIVRLLAIMCKMYPPATASVLVYVCMCVGGIKSVSSRWNRKSDEELLRAASRV